MWIGWSVRESNGGSDNPAPFLNGASHSGSGHGYGNCYMWYYSNRESTTLG